MRTVAIVMLLVAAAGAGAHGQETPRRVVVMPFNGLGMVDRTSGIGASIQHVLVAELARMKGIDPVAPAPANAGQVTIETARKAANEAGADLVIFGSYHLHERDLRIVGQVLDVPSNRLVGGLKATGAAPELFAIQDIIAQQVRPILTARVRPDVKGTAETAAPAAAVIEPLGAVKAVRAWEEYRPVMERARERIANQSEFERATYAYRYSYGGAPVYGFRPAWVYPYYYPRVYHRHYWRW